ncbi:MAG: MGMT family protein [Patescibacteria group bacterium]
MVETSFTTQVLNAVNAVPYGQVASYGQIALMVGMPRAARQVGWVLNRLEDSAVDGSSNHPWWRIVNNTGRISIKGTKVLTQLTQKELLEKEGIEVSDDLTFDIERYRYRPQIAKLEEFELAPEYIEKFIQKYLD